MNPFGAVALKVVGSGVAAALVSLGVAGTLAQAAPSPSPSPGASTTAPAQADRHADRKLVRQAVLESEADVLGMPEGNLVAALKKGGTVSDLARSKGLTEQQFAARMVVDLKPRLEQLVDHKQLTQAQADRILTRIGKGHVPFWNGIRHRKK